MTYHGMSLGGEIRESISLDEDDLSDVEDEVFIRDGKNGYRLADDLGAKRPLMAPRRKQNKPDLASRLRNRPPFRAMCKPCLYGLGAFIIFLILVVLIAVVVSLFPLPINKLKQWMSASRSVNTANVNSKSILPCVTLRVSDVWTMHLPKLTSETSIRAVDIDKDGVDDFIFGFGTGDNNFLDPNVTCPIFFGVPAPCAGGVIALNGSTGITVWRKYLTGTPYSVFCSSDVDGDAVNDCLVVTGEGMILMINPVNGSIIWEYGNDQFSKNRAYRNIYTANFALDFNGDNVSDILAAHSIQPNKNDTQDFENHLHMLCGKTGKEIQQMAVSNNEKTFYMPQVLIRASGNVILFGTGLPNSSGSLNYIYIKDFLSGNNTYHTIYKDNYKGALTPSVLVDITGDGQLDIVSAMFNSTIIAIDGANFTQIWNFTIPDSETLAIPTPGYFNNDNVTDFVVKYQTGRGYNDYYYSQTFIIDGKTGKRIYDKPLVDSVGGELGGLTIRMRPHGFDFFLFWMQDCLNYEGRGDPFTFVRAHNFRDQTDANICALRFNSSKVVKLHALNQFQAPPGIVLYDSVKNRPVEYGNSSTPLEEASEFFINHQDFKFDSGNTDDDISSEMYKKMKYQDAKDRTSPFRHKGNSKGLVKNKFKTQDDQKLDANEPARYEDPISNSYDDYTVPDVPSYRSNSEMNYYNVPALSYSATSTMNRESNPIANPVRDPRSKEEKNADADNKEPALSSSYGVYDYRNVHNARTRLAHDLNSSPDEILQDTYYKSREKQLRRSARLQRPRDINNKPLNEDEINAKVSKTIADEKIENERKTASLNLWNLESEQEQEDHEYRTGKRKRQGDKLVPDESVARRKRHRVVRSRRDTVLNDNFWNKNGIPRVTSLGTIVKSLNESENAVDMVFLTYWTPAKQGLEILIQQDLDCIQEKITKALSSNQQFLTYETGRLRERFRVECLQLRGSAQHQYDEQQTASSLADGVRSNFPYYEQISKLSYGQMTVYRVRITCGCDAVAQNRETCGTFAPMSEHDWTSYMGRSGDGVLVPT